MLQQRFSTRPPRVRGPFRGSRHAAVDVPGSAAVGLPADVSALAKDAERRLGGLEASPGVLLISEFGQKIDRQATGLGGAGGVYAKWGTSPKNRWFHWFGWVFFHLPGKPIYFSKRPPMEASLQLGSADAPKPYPRREAAGNLQTHPLLPSGLLPICFPTFVGKGFPFKLNQHKRMPCSSHGRWAFEHQFWWVDHTGSSLASPCGLVSP